MKKKHFLKLYLRLKVNPDGKEELWISPDGDMREYFLTKGKTSLEEIKKFKPKDALF